MEASASGEERIEYRDGKARMVFTFLSMVFMVGLFLFGVLGPWTLDFRWFEVSMRMVAVPALLYALTLTVWAGWRLFDPRPTLSIGPEGVGVGARGLMIAWDNIKNVEIIEGSFVQLALDDPEPYLAQLGAWQGRRARRYYRKSGLASVGVPTAFLDVSPEELVRLIRARAGLLSPADTHEHLPQDGNAQ